MYSRDNTLYFQSIYRRRELARIQLEEQQKKKAEIDAANESRLNAIEATRAAALQAARSTALRLPPSRTSLIPKTPSTASTNPQPVLTPLISPALQMASTLHRTRPAITPVSNVLAMQRAKEKIDQMNALKRPTIAQTSSKAGSRVAHVKVVPEVYYLVKENVVRVYTN